jgi:hypothetical protein
MRETTTAPPTGEAVRDHLIAALQADLIGPFAGPTDAPEVLQLPPSRWYLTGFLAPEAGRIVDDPTADDELPAGDDDEGDEGSDAEPLPKQRKIFPASIGLSVLIPPGADGPLTTTLTWAEYTEDKVDTDPQLDGPDRKAKTVKVWVRRPCGPALTLVPLDPERLAAGVPVTDAPGIWLIGQIQAADGQGLPSGARALSLFVVNRRAVPEIARAEEHFLFQVALTVEHPAGFLPRPNRTGERSDDFDDRVADLHYRAHTELVVGHGVAAEPDPQAPQVHGWPTRVRTTWLPQAEVRRVKTHLEPGVETRMDHLAEITDAQGAEHKLGRLVSAYGAWLAAQAQIPLDSEDRRATQSALLRRGEAARARIAGGIALLGSDPELRRAFSLANQAMAMASRQRFGPDSTPTWHLFQLAFLLQNLAGIATPATPPRRRRAHLLPDRRRQDRGLPRRHRLHPAAPAHPRPGPPRRGPRRRGAPALHPAPPDPRPARPRRDPDLRPRAATPGIPPELGEAALGRSGCGSAAAPPPTRSPKSPPRSPNTRTTAARARSR